MYTVMMASLRQNFGKAVHIQDNNHSVIEQPKLERALKDHLMQSLWERESRWCYLTSYLSNCIFKPSNEEDPTISLRKLF